jgi:hypothetical protein
MLEKITPDYIILNQRDFKIMCLAKREREGGRSV